MTLRGVVAESAAQQALVRRAIGLSSAGGLEWSGAMGGGVNRVEVSQCTLGGACTLGGVAEGGEGSWSIISTLGADTSGGCCKEDCTEAFNCEELIIRFGRCAVSL